MSKDNRRVVLRNDYSPHWASRAVDTYSKIELDPHEVIQYKENADGNLWFRQAKKPFLLTILFFFIVCFANNWMNFLDPIMLVLGHTFLSPLKSLLLDTQPAAMTGLVGTVSCVLWIFFGSFAAALFRKALTDALNPTHVALTDRSFMLVRYFSGTKYVVLEEIGWTSITSVQLHRAAGNRSIRDYQIQFCGSVESATGESRESELISFRFGDVFMPEERAYLLRCIQSMVPRFDSAALEVLQPTLERQSYTELWLRELSAPPKRDKLTPLAPGALVNESNYRVMSKIGVGGQATVYMAQPTTLESRVGTEVVLKEFLLPVYPDPRVRKQAAEKFQQEAAMLSTLRHPRIVRFIDLFIEDHRAYLVLEKITGNTLKELVETEGQQPQDYVLELALQMTDILQYLHGMQPPIVHRDFTPDNIMLADDGIKLIDFSVAQKMESVVTGSVVGKPSYLAPEQFRGKPTTQSDLYSLGATLYFLLVGTEPPPITCLHPIKLSANVSPEMDAIIARSTQLDPAKRYDKVETLRADLERIKH